MNGPRVGRNGKKDKNGRKGKGGKPKSIGPKVIKNFVRKRPVGAIGMSASCITNHHIECCKECDCICHRDKVLIEHFRNLYRRISAGITTVTPDSLLPESCLPVNLYGTILINGETAGSEEARQYAKSRQDSGVGKEESAGEDSRG